MSVSWLFFPTTAAPMLMCVNGGRQSWEEDKR
jgi:hypothetical protein